MVASQSEENDLLWTINSDSFPFQTQLMESHVRWILLTYILLRIWVFYVIIFVMTRTAIVVMLCYAAMFIYNVEIADCNMLNQLHAVVVWSFDMTLY